MDWPPQSLAAPTKAQQDLFAADVLRLHGDEAEAAKALPELNNDAAAHAKELSGLLIDTTSPDTLREAVAAALGQDHSPETMNDFTISEAMKLPPDAFNLVTQKS